MKAILVAGLLLPIASRGGEAPAAPDATPLAAEAYWAPVLDLYPRPGSLHGVANLNLTDCFITANGLLLENQGVVVQPMLLLNTPLYSAPTRCLNTVSFTLGAWSSWDSHEGGEDPGNWREVDLLAGLTLAFERNWRFTAFHTTYLSQTDSFATASDLALALTCDDTEWLGAAALHPFVEFKWQTAGSTTQPYADAPADGGRMLRAGIVPQRQFGRYKLELPVYCTLVSDGFYQGSEPLRAAGYDGSPVAGLGWRPEPGGIGFMSAALKLSLPLECLSTAGVHTTAYAAVQYYHLVNSGLLDTNQVLGATADRRDDLLQFHVGLNLAF
jgi:hypothetical protein